MNDSTEDWSQLRTAIGPATFVPDAIDRMLGAHSDSEAADAYWELDNRVVIQGQLFEAAEQTTMTLLSRLLSGDSTPAGVGRALDLLVEIAAGEPDTTELARGNDGLAERCLALISAAAGGLREIPTAENPRAAAALQDLLAEMAE